MEEDSWLQRRERKKKKRATMKGSRRRLSSKVTMRTGGSMLIEWYPKQLSALGVVATRGNKFEGSSVAGLDDFEQRRLSDGFSR